MPYITRAQKEWLNFCDLSFAIHQIRTAENCDETAAMHQLLLAIADGNVRVAWADRPSRGEDSEKSLPRHQVATALAMRTQLTL
jgi:hypothetical protein